MRVFDLVAVIAGLKKKKMMLKICQLAIASATVLLLLS